MRSRLRLVVACGLGAVWMMSAATPSSARIFTVAAPLFGQAGVQYDGAIATEAGLSGSLAVAPDGSILVADGDVWRIGLDGRVTRIAGNGRQGFAGDRGPATAANVDANEVAVTAEGAVLIVDTSHHRIRRVGPDGIITTVAGSGPTEDDKPGAFAGDGGPATQARLNFPSDVTSTTDGGFLIAEEIGERIRRVAPDGTITTVAGAGTDPGPSSGSVGDAGPATAASLSRPLGVAEMPDGGFVIADTARLRRVAPDGTISTLAGASARGGTPATTARFEPRSVAVAPGGDVLFSDDDRHRIWRLTPDGRIFTVAGSELNYSGYADRLDAFIRDGDFPTAAILSGPRSVAVSPAGDLFFNDGGRLRFVASPHTPRLAVALQAMAGRASASGYRARVVSTLAARVSVAVGGPGGRERTATRNTTPGSPATVAFRRRFAPGIYAVRTIATTTAGAVATHTTRLVLGGRLPERVAEAVTAREIVDEEHKDSPPARVGPCHRFAADRIDCEVEQRPVGSRATCGWLVSTHVTASGLLRDRIYLCPGRTERLFRRRPRWNNKPTWVIVSDVQADR